MAPSISSKSSNIFKILWEALIFLIRNWKPLLFFSFFYFISFLFSIFKSFSVTPILTNLAKNIASLPNLQPSNPDFYQLIALIQTELREISAIEASFFVASFFFSTLLLTSTLCFTCMTYADNKQPAPKELFSKFRKTWKRAAITQFYVTIFNIIGVLLILFLAVGFVLTSMNSAAFLVVGILLLAVIMCLSLYLAIIWSLSLVVSVEDEDGSYGLAAIVKATEMIKGGRRKGILLNVFLSSSNMAVSFFLNKHFSSSEMEKVVIFGVVFAVLAVLSVFDLAVITLFYYECKKRDGGMMMPMKAEYSSLPSDSGIL